MFPHHNIHRFTWISPDKKAHYHITHILIDIAFKHTSCPIVEGSILCC
jgi:hypothetical protein